MLFTKNNLSVLQLVPFDLSYVLYFVIFGTYSIIFVNEKEALGIGTAEVNSQF